MTEWTMPAGLNQPLPRRTRMSKGYKITLSLITFGFLVALIWMTVVEYRKDEKIHILQLRGVGADAEIVRLYTEQVKHGIDYYADYQFQADAPGTSGPSLFQSEDQISEDHYNSLQQSGASVVPILYDPLDPSKSLTNLDSCFYHKRPFEDFLNFSELSLSFIGLYYAIIVSFFLVPYYRQRKLLQLGTPVAATIVSEREYAVKGGRRSALTYEFVDDFGHTQQGVRKGVRTEDGSGSYLSGDRDAIFDNPTALFDPKNSKRSMLYPPVGVQLV